MGCLKAGECGCGQTRVHRCPQPHLSQTNHRHNLSPHNSTGQPQNGHKSHSLLYGMARGWQEGQVALRGWNPPPPGHGQIWANVLPGIALHFQATLGTELLLLVVQGACQAWWLCGSKRHGQAPGWGWMCMLVVGTHRANHAPQDGPARCGAHGRVWEFGAAF